MSKLNLNSNHKNYDKTNLFSWDYTFYTARQSYKNKQQAV